MSTYASSLSSFVTDFFSPPISSPTAQPHLPEKDLFDHFTSYVISANGSRDVMRIFEYAASYFQSVFAARIKGVACNAGMALTVPKIITDATFFKASLKQLSNAYQIPSGAEHRDRAIAHAYKKSVIDGMNVGNTLSEVFLFLHEVHLLELGKHLPVLETIYNGTSIVNDTIEIFEEGIKWEHYNSVQSSSDRETIEIQEKKTLSLMKITKDIPSVAGSVLGLASVFFVSMNMTWVATASLGLNVIWLTMKIASNVFERKMHEDQARRLLQPA